MTVTLVAKVTYLPTAQGHDNFEHPCVTPLDLVPHQKRECSPVIFPELMGHLLMTAFISTGKHLGKNAMRVYPPNI